MLTFGKLKGNQCGSTQNLYSVFEQESSSVEVSKTLLMLPDSHQPQQSPAGVVDL